MSYSVISKIRIFYCIGLGLDMSAPILDVFVNVIGSISLISKSANSAISFFKCTVDCQVIMLYKVKMCNLRIP